MSAVIRVFPLKRRVRFPADGITWTQVADSTFGGSTVRAIAYGGGKFVAVGVGGKIAYSTDGVSWTSLGSPLGSRALYAAATRTAR
ncbi:MAG: hypothetical protein LBP19_00095 [Treponema sp.]|nr:hypothetical protein [Treponema sp.]